MTSPIALAVQPRRQAAIDRALDCARGYVRHVEARLMEHGMNIDAAFPRPKHTMSRRDYVATQNLRSSAARLVRNLPKQSYRPDEPTIVVMDADNISRFFDSVYRDAAAQFDDYVAKLESKVGKADEAVIDDSPLWNGSVLTVRVAGEIQRWKTKMIVNVSCLGKLFNQFPTRRMA